MSTEDEELAAALQESMDDVGKNIKSDKVVLFVFLIWV